MKRLQKVDGLSVGDKCELPYQNGSLFLELLAENENKGLWNEGLLLLIFAKTAAASQDGEVAATGVVFDLDLLVSTGSPVAKCLKERFYASKYYSVASQALPPVNYKSF